MLRVAIFADDLTGALDSAEPFARMGARVTVATSPAAMPAIALASYDVIAVNTDSRAMTPEAAARAVKEAWGSLVHWRPDCVFKKIDSRMKGNIGAELGALLEESGRSRAAIAPAIPEIGRITSRGMVTGFGIDEPLAIARLPEWRPEWTVADCQDGDMLAEIAKQALTARETTVAAGASALAEAMAYELASNRPRASTYPGALPKSLPLLMVIGSRDPITLKQIATLAQSDIPYVTSLPDRALSYPEGTELILLLPPHEGGDPALVANELAQRAIALLKRCPISAVLVSGGDTAAAFVRHAKIGELVPSGLLARGIPVSCATTGDLSLDVISKSGGFGSPTTLVQVFHHWREMVTGQP